MRARFALSTCTGEELENSSMPVARVPVTMTVSGSGSEDSGAIASADASCACSASGVQAKLPNKVDLRSQLFAAWRRFPRFVCMRKSP